MVTEEVMEEVYTLWDGLDPGAACPLPPSAQLHLPTPLLRLSPSRATGPVSNVSLQSPWRACQCPRPSTDSAILGFLSHVEENTLPGPLQCGSLRRKSRIFQCFQNPGMGRGQWEAFHMGDSQSPVADFQPLRHIESAMHSFFFFFSPCSKACGILVSRSGLKPAPAALESWSLNHWTTSLVPKVLQTS